MLGFENALVFALTEPEKTGRLIVADEGLGIRKEDQEKLFSPDKHISTHGTSNETGAGLGLIIAQEFILLNEGHIDLESSPGEGSTFTITLPGKDESIT